MRAALAALAVITLAAAGCGGGNDEATTASGCVSVDLPDLPEPADLQAPTDKLDRTKTYTLTFDTTCGTFVVTLDSTLAPNTAASLVALARAGYFDDTIFHRIVPGFVIQGGDPTQVGSGGPGYKTVDKPPADARYTRATVAMAKTELEAPGTAGSQFFVVTADDAGLPPEYAIVGRVTDGMGVVDRIGGLGDANERPTQTVVIRTVTVGVT